MSERDLVQDEGVNAGSAEQGEDADEATERPGAEAARKGGHPEDGPEDEAPLAQQSGGPDLAGAGGTSEDGTSGQDEGSMG